MKIRIESIRRLGKVPADIRKEHKGFDEWDFVLGPHDHPSILQVICYNIFLFFWIANFITNCAFKNLIVDPD